MEHNFPTDQSPLPTLTNQDPVGNDPHSVGADDLDLTSAPILCAATDGKQLVDVVPSVEAEKAEVLLAQVDATRQDISPDEERYDSDSSGDSVMWVPRAPSKTQMASSSHKKDPKRVPNGGTAAQSDKSKEEEKKKKKKKKKKVPSSQAANAPQGGRAKR